MKRTVIPLILLLLLLLCSCAENKSEDYALVNGEIITKNEIEYFKNRCRADIINEYAEQYGITDFSDFWEVDYSGENPAQALEKRAFDEAVKAKIKLIMMREYGIYDDISFDALREKANKFNAKNEKAGGVVGIKSIDLGSFYTYYISTGELELINILGQGLLKPTEEELSDAYRNAPASSENALISSIVSGKYDKLISEAAEEAEIELLDKRSNE